MASGSSSTGRLPLVGLVGASALSGLPPSFSFSAPSDRGEWCRSERVEAACGRRAGLVSTGTAAAAGSSRGDWRGQGACARASGVGAGGGRRGRRRGYGSRGAGGTRWQRRRTAGRASIGFGGRGAGIVAAERLPRSASSVERTQSRAATTIAAMQAACRGDPDDELLARQDRAQLDRGVLERETGSNAAGGLVLERDVRPLRIGAGLKDGDLVGGRNAALHDGERLRGLEQLARLASSRSGR